MNFGTIESTSVNYLFRNEINPITTFVDTCEENGNCHHLNKDSKCIYFIGPPKEMRYVMFLLTLEVF